MHPGSIPGQASKLFNDLVEASDYGLQAEFCSSCPVRIRRVRAKAGCGCKWCDNPARRDGFHLFNPPSVIVPRVTEPVDDAVVFDGRLEDSAGGQGAHVGAMQFLPGAL